MKINVLTHKVQIASMKEHINFNGSNKTIREVQPNKVFQINVRSRIPIRIPIKDKISVISAAPKTSCISQIKSVSTLPEKRYGKDRTRLVSNYGKRFSKTVLETQISSKYRKYNWEKSKLINQQLNYEKECDEMKVLLEKMKNFGDGEFTFSNNTNTSCDVGVTNEFPIGCQMNELRLSTSTSKNYREESTTAVHHRFLTSNTEIFALLKALGEQAIELYYHQTMNNDNKTSNDNVNFFANFLKLRTGLFEATNEGNNKLLEYNNEINQLKSTNEDLTEKLKLAEQQLVTQAAENKSIQENREESFMKIEEKLRDIIEKFQCQFRAQKLLQAKTERELAVLRSDFFMLEREKNKLNVEFTSCCNELKECQKVNVVLKEKADVHCKEQEEMGKKLVATQKTIDRLEFELVAARNKSNECNAAQVKGEAYENIYFSGALSSRFFLN